MVTNFVAKFAKWPTLPSCGTLVFQKGLQDRNFDLED